MPSGKPKSELVFHYKCKICRALVALEDGRWIDEGHSSHCQKPHLSNGQYANGSRSSTCRDCGVPLKWVDMAWRSSASIDPHY